ncbi:hypothetical protein GF342_03135 [Candidatus Woesearchaeota archaeon]|nr:hypothetical protein [Candidatus Woesearchaeota archaeon]
MSNGYILGVVALVALIVMFSFVFFWDIIALLVNLILLYVVLARIHFTWKKGEISHYVIGGTASLLITFLAGSVYPFWRLTSFFIVTAVIAELMYLLPRRRRRR